MHETFGEVGSRESKLAFLGFLRTSEGSIDMIETVDMVFMGLTGGLWKVTAVAACGRNFNDLLLSFDGLSIEK